MTRQLLLVFLMCVTVGAPAAAAPIAFSAVLSGSAEFPPNASPGTGMALVTIDDVAHTMAVDVTFQALVGLVTVSHIHVINGPGDANTSDTVGPVATTTPTFLGFPSGVTSGAYSNLFDMTDATSFRAGFIADAGGFVGLAEAALFDAILTGRAYLNIHTNAFPGGEIRGFLAPVSSVPVPEPTTLALVGLGSVLLLVRSRRRG